MTYFSKQVFLAWYIFLVGFDGGGEIDSLTGSGGHVNFFQNLEDGEKMEKVDKETFN